MYTHGEIITAPSTASDDDDDILGRGKSGRKEKKT